MRKTYPQIGICGLSCRLCPAYHRETVSKCEGCKTKSRVNVGCTFIRCAFKKKDLEFCWLCEDTDSCRKFRKHKEFSRHHDSFVCYQKLEENIGLAREDVVEFEQDQKKRENLLKEMLSKFNEGRSKTYYCIASSVCEIEDLKRILDLAKVQSIGLDIKEKSKVLHHLLDNLAKEKNLLLKLRK
jgi:hypothetical protein